ncbi:MAG: hypothetical protein AB7K41_02595 [Bdellovibrionales bacterium]
MKSHNFRTSPVSLKRVILSGLFFGVLLSVSPLAHAAERYEFYNGVRQLGMGGAGVAVVNDETALLLNPAGLGKLRDYFVTVADPELEGSANAATLAGTDLLNMFKPQPMLNKLNQVANRDKRLHLKAQLFPSIVVPNFGFGVYGNYTADGRVDAAGTNYELHYNNDYAAVFGFNFRLFDGIIKLGAVARAINRVQIDRIDIPANSTGLTVDNLAQEGFGVAGDVGLILAAPIAWLPTIAAVWRDVGGTSYNLKEGMFTSAITIPNHTPQTVDVAFALFPIASKRTRVTFTGEYRDVLTTGDEDDQMRRVHAGIEMNVADAFFLRAGMNQRYWTAGLEFAMQNYQLQAATYGEEVGTATITQEDRRYVFKFAFRF